MIGYRDRTYCGSDVEVHTCGGEFTEQDAKDAEEWWGNKDYPIAKEFLSEQLITITNQFALPFSIEPRKFSHILEAFLLSKEHFHALGFWPQRILITMFISINVLIRARNPATCILKRLHDATLVQRCPNHYYATNRI